MSLILTEDFTTKENIILSWTARKTERKRLIILKTGKRFRCLRTLKMLFLAVWVDQKSPKSSICLRLKTEHIFFATGWMAKMMILTSGRDPIIFPLRYMTRTMI